MRFFARALAAVAVGTSAWCVLGSPAVLDPSGLTRVGILPPWWVLAACVGLALGVASTRHVARAALLPLLIFPVFVLPWLPGRVPPAFLLWTGRLGTGVALLAVWAVLVSLPWRAPGALAALVRDPRRAPLLGAVAALAVFLAGARHLQGMVPGGDEPHYLIITQSLLRDGDLQIENNHLRRDYLPYFTGTLRPDYLRRGTNQQIYSIHMPGISALVLPAFAVAGYPGAVVFVSLVAALGTGLVWRLAWRLTGSAAAAWFGWATVTISTPFTIQAFSIYPDATASVLALTGVAALMLPVSRPLLSWVLHGAALGLLPWLHARHAVLAGLLGAFIAWRLARAGAWSRLAGFSAVPALCAAGWVSYFWIIYGSPSPSAAYGGVRQTTSFAYLPVTIPGLLFDQQFGLVATAPVLGIAVVGLLVLLSSRRSAWSELDASPRVLGLQLAVLFAAYAAASGTYRMWWAGSSSPARFLVPLVLPLGVCAAAFWHGTGRASRVLAAGALVLTTALSLVFLGVEHGRLAFNFRDGYALLLDWLSPVADLSNAMPSLIRDRLDLARVRIAWWAGGAATVWLGLAILGWCREWSRGASALAMLWLGAVATMGAASGSWAAGGAAQVRPGASQLAALHASERWGTRAVGFSAAPTAGLATTLDVVARLRLTNVSRRPPASGDLLLLADLPAGRYRVRADGPVLADVDVSVGRGPVFAHWSAERLRSPAGVEITLPVDVRAVVVRGTVPPGSEGPHVWAEPVELATRGVKVPGLAVIGARYGDVAVFGLDDLAYVEPGGVWTQPGRRAEFVMVSERSGPLRLALSGGPYDNTCVIERDGWQERVALPAGDRHEVRVPGDGRTPGRIAVTAGRGFRPSDLDPASGDNRRLGCRIEFE